MRIANKPAKNEKKRKENKEDKSLFCFIVFKTTSDSKDLLD